MDNKDSVVISSSKIKETSKLYFRANIIDAEVSAHCIIGESSRIKQSLLEEYVSIDRNNLVMCSHVGRYSYTGPFDMIFNTQIGGFCSISYGVTIGPPDHDFNRLTTHPFLHNSRYGIFDEAELLPVMKFQRECEIGNDVWIGCNSTILRGVKIGDGAVIGANALVNKDVPPYAIVAGVPAKVIKYRFDEDVIGRLLEIKWWTWEIERIRKNKSLFLGNVTLEKLENVW